jgi:hypothetical protein
MYQGLYASLSMAPSTLPEHYFEVDQSLRKDAQGRLVIRHERGAGTHCGNRRLLRGEDDLIDLALFRR